MRADLALTERNLCASRAQAQALIQAGKVQWRRAGFGDWLPVKKAAQPIEGLDEIRVDDNQVLQYVSRGGHKLAGALDEIGLDVRDMRCADFGQSTGGFTDCLLSRMAQSVIGLDVGKDQLHPRLKADPRVVALEGINLKTCDAPALKAQWLKQWPERCPIDLAVADLSFISLTKVLGNLVTFLEPGSQLVLLVKPQFELGPQWIGKNGLVKNLEHALPDLEQNIRVACQANRVQVGHFWPSSIAGGDGNQEYFVHGTLGTLKETIE